MSSLKTLVFSDLDGTLLDHFTYEFTPALPTLERLAQAGIPCILNTSKTFAELTVIHRELKLNSPFIVENGAAIYLPIGSFEQQPQDTEVCGDYWVKSFCRPISLWLDLLNKHCHAFAGEYRGFSQHTDASLAKLTGLTLEQAKRARQRQFGEPLEWLGDIERKSAFIQKLKELGATVVEGGRFIHLGDDCSKGQALLWLADLYQRESPDSCFQTIALGDGGNDIPMLEVADIAVQIRSPIHEFPLLVTEKKQIKTTLCGPEGWAEALEQLLLNELATQTSTPNLAHQNTQE